MPHVIPTPTPTPTHPPVPPTKLTSQQTHGGNEQRNTRASDDLSCGLDLSCGRELGRGLDRTLAPEHITHDCTDSTLVMSQTSPKPTKHNNPNPNDCHAWKRCTRCATLESNHVHLSSFCVNAGPICMRCGVGESISFSFSWISQECRDGGGRYISTVTPPVASDLTRYV